MTTPWEVLERLRMDLQDEDTPSGYDRYVAHLAGLVRDDACELAGVPFGILPTGDEGPPRGEARERAESS